MKRKKKKIAVCKACQHVRWENDECRMCKGLVPVAWDTAETLNKRTRVVKRTYVPVYPTKYLT